MSRIDRPTRRTQTASATHLPRRPPVRLAAAVFAALMACAAAVTWFVLEPVRDRVIAEALGTEIWPDAGTLASWVTTPQWGLLAATLALLAATVWLELRRGAFSALLAPNAGSWPAWTCFTALLVWFGHSYLGHGVLLSGDTIAHVSMITTRAGALLTGDDPTWSNFKYNGLPLQAFYSPTTIWPIVWLAGLTGSAPLALRLFLFATHLASGLAMLALARRLRLPRLAAMAAAIVYAGAFAHLHLLLYRGAIPQALSMALFPAALLFLHRLITGGSRRWLDAAGLAGAVAGLVVNYTPFAIVAAVFMAGFAAITIAGSGLWRDRAAWRRFVPPLVVAAALTVGLAAFVLLPAGSLHSDVKPVSLGHLVELRWPSLAYFDQLLVWRAWRSNLVGAPAYLGITAILLAGSALWRLRRRNPARWTAWGLGALLLASLFVRGEHVRDIMVTLAFLAPLAGLGAAAAPRWALLLLLLDLGSTAIQPVGRTDKGYLDAGGAYLERQPPSRTMEGSIWDGHYFAAIGGPGLLSWHALELVGGGHVEMATPSWVAADLASQLVNQDLWTTGALSRRTVDVLCLLRVGRLVADHRTGLGIPETVQGGPLVDAVEEGPLGRVLKPRCAPPAIFAPAVAQARAEPLDPLVTYAPDAVANRAPAFASLIDDVLDQMHLDRATGVASVIPVQEILPAPAAGGNGLPFGVADYAVSSGRIGLTVDAPSAGFVRLSHAWQPRQVARRNGAEVSTARDPLGFMVVPVLAGRNTLTITPVTEPVQNLGDAISLSALGVLAILTAWAAAARRVTAA